MTSWPSTPRRFRSAGSARSRTSPRSSRSSPARTPATCPARSCTRPAAPSARTLGDWLASPGTGLYPPGKNAATIGLVPDLEEERELRERVRAFFAEHPPAQTSRLDFLRARFDAGLGFVHYPV